MRPWFVLSLPVVSLFLLPKTASAQDIRTRLWRAETQKDVADTRFRLVQLDVPSSPRPTTPGPNDVPANSNPDDATGQVTRPPVRTRGRKPISISLDTRLGFDNDKVFVNATVPFQVNVRRRIRTVVITGQYPISPRTSVSLNLPYISQTTRNSVPGGSITQRGNGIGDISFWVSHRMPNYRKAREFSIAGGLILPTGKDPFKLTTTQLATGLGFYQPAVRLSMRTLSVPLQFYGSIDYSKGLSRSANGASVHLPASYGAEVGFFYTLGPQWATQTSVSLGKASSPVLQNSGDTVGYLTQALNYRTGDRTNFRGSVDVGLTDASTDAYFSLALDTSF